MDENKLKVIIEEVINKAVDPIKEDLSEVKEDLAEVKLDLSGVKEDLNGVKEDLAGIKETQEDHTRRLEALSGDMEQVLSEVKATHDEIGLNPFWRGWTDLLCTQLKEFKPITDLLTSNYEKGIYNLWLLGRNKKN